MMSRNTPAPEELNGEKTPEELGQEYERYVGYHLETEGWRVIYCGAKKGKKDSGIDLICSKGNRRLLVQCKRWSKLKQIGIEILDDFAKSIERYKRRIRPRGQLGFREFGADELAIGARIYTTITFENGVKKRAEGEKIHCIESFAYKSRYPMIKCYSVKSNGQGLYTLPSDYGYDSVKMNLAEGDQYVWSEDEAVAKGFRKAARRGNS